MADIGTATIRILADSSAFDRALGGIAKGAENAGERIGSRLGQSAGRALRLGLVAAVGGAAAAIGLTLAKGFKRFTTIEDATASLTLQLGNAADAAKLLDDTLAVVEGTPFALDQFVDAARNLVAASIPLEKVPGILQAVADGAAAAGGSAQDVDNVVNALGRLATGAELTLGPIRDLEEQGVPALRILANRAGKSTRQMAKDITAGTVDSQKAIDDLVAGIIEGTDGINGATVAFGGAAKNVGNTVSGAYANMQTAIARAGAKVIAVFADSGAGGNALVRVLNSLRDTIDILGDRAVVMAERFVGSDGFGRILAFFDELPDRVRTEGLIAPLLDGLRQGFESIPTDKLGDVFALIIVRGIEAIAERIPVIIAAVVHVAPQIILGIIEGLLRAAAENPLDMVLFLGALGIPGVGAAIAAFFRALPFGGLVAPLITGLTSAIRAGFALLISRVAPLLAGFGPAVSSGLAAGITGAAGLAIAVVLGVGLGIIFHNAIERFLPEVNRALERFGGRVYDFFADLPERLSGALQGLGGRMYDVGVAALQGIQRGAAAVASGWGGFWSDIGASAYDAVANAIGAQSPAKAFMPLGESMIDGIVVGVRDSLPRLDSALTNLAPPASTRLSASVRGGDGSAAPTSVGGVVQNITIESVQDLGADVQRVLARLAVG